MIEYLARDIPAFVMYCVNGASRSSPLVESTDSMISLASQTYVARAEKRGRETYVWWTGFCASCRNVGSTNQIAVSA